MPNVRVAHQTIATALIDGDNGLGHLAMAKARDIAIETARTAGIGWVGIRRGNHAGPLALYVRPQAEAGMVGMAVAVGSANHVPPFGGSDLPLGTNPVAFCAPADGPDPVVFDMATTVAAMGKIKTLLQQGAPMPEGWMGNRSRIPRAKPRTFFCPLAGRRALAFPWPLG